jgi:hypothetical protein
MGQLEQLVQLEQLAHTDIQELVLQDIPELQDIQA